MAIEIGQDIPDNNPHHETDEDVLNDADSSHQEMRAKNSMPSWLPPPPIQAAAVVKSGNCTLYVTSIDYDRKRDAMAAKVHAECTTGGFSDFTLYCSLSKIRKVVKQALQRNGYGNRKDIMGSFLDDIGNAVSSAVNDVGSVAQSIVKDTGVGEVVKGVEAVASLPGFKQALGVGGMIFPPLGVSLSAINAAGNLINKASSGDQGAKNQVYNVMTKAWSTQDPAAIKAGTTLATVYQAKQAMAAQAPLLTRTVHNAIQVSLMPNATDQDKRLVNEIFAFFDAIANGQGNPLAHMQEVFPDAYAPGQFPPGPVPYGQNYVNQYAPGQMPMNPVRTPFNQNQGSKDYTSNGTHVTISGWSPARIGRLRKALIGRGMMRTEIGFSLPHFDQTYAQGSALMLAAATR